jgi:nitrogen fixation protein NifU and related proteins
MPDEDDLSLLAQHVLDHYEDPYHQGDCPAATHALRRDSQLCGDWVRVELAVSPQDEIAEAWFEGDGCALSQAAASMLMEKIEGMTRQQVRQFSAMHMLELFGTGLLPSRQKCWLLPWRVLQGAIDSPLASDAYDMQSDQPHFGGPSLKEES